MLIVTTALRLVHNTLYALRHNRTSLLFRWARTCRDAGIESDSIHRDVSEPLEKVTTSGCNATRTLYRELASTQAKVPVKLQNPEACLFPLSYKSIFTILQVTDRNVATVARKLYHLLMKGKKITLHVYS